MAILFIKIDSTVDLFKTTLKHITKQNSSLCRLHAKKEFKSRIHFTPKKGKTIIFSSKAFRHTLSPTSNVYYIEFNHIFKKNEYSVFGIVKHKYTRRT